jgi:diguanylate cyclase (GGDEF)-like protein
MRKVILLIDDSAAVHQVVKAYLSPRFDIVSAYDGKTGLVAAEKSKPELILLDVAMPAIGGFEVCRQLKADRVTRSIPVMFLTAAHSVAERIRGLEAGACDYITKPFEPTELRARVRAVLRTQKALDQMVQNTMVDELTGLFDRRYFEAQLDAGLAAARRTGKPLGCILVDIDEMHVVNGAFGRELGDQMLCAVSRCLTEICRREDVLCRFGGDRFVVLVPAAKVSSLRIFAERVRMAVRAAVLCDASRVIRVKASVGVSLSSVTDGISVLPATEEALARAKQDGGDCIRFGRKLLQLRSAA